MAAAGSPQDLLSHLSLEERDLVFRFLALVRDNYKKADKAAYFLERRAGVINTCGMTNLRDVLSHLSTLLDPATPPRKRLDQLASAEEHLRRAILEPYEIGLASLTEKFSQDYEAYRKQVLPVKDALDGFRAAPNRTQIESRLEEINDLALKGKQAKGRNIWDDEWEDGVAAFADAYDKLLALHSELEDWIFRHNQYLTTQAATSLTNTAQHHTRLHKWAIAWAIGGILIGSAITYMVTKYVAGPERQTTQQTTSPAPTGK